MLFSDEIKDRLDQFEKLLKIIENIAKKELKGQEISVEEYQTIWNIGSTLNALTTFPHDVISRKISGIDERMAVITDVHTDTNSGQVLQEAVGFPFIIYIKIYNKGKEQIFQGPVFSYYEFKQPMSNRLTDEQWQKMLKQSQDQSLPEWTSVFIGK